MNTFVTRNEVQAQVLHAQIFYYVVQVKKCHTFVFEIADCVFVLVLLLCSAFALALHVFILNVQRTCTSCIFFNFFIQMIHYQEVVYHIYHYI